MTQRIEFEGAVHEFPDDFSQGDIAKALKTPVNGTAKPTPDYPGGRQSELRGPEPLWHKAISMGLPIATAVGGGALGGPGGGIAGYAGGREGVRLIDEINRRRGQWPYGTGTSPLEHFRQTTNDAAAAAAAETTGGALRGAPSVGRSLFQRLAGSEAATPERNAVLEAAKKQGIPLTIGAESGSRTASAIQRVPELALFGGRSIPAAREATRKGAEGAVERVIAKEGGPVTSESGGSAVKLDIRQRLEAARDRFAKGVGQRQAGIAERMEATKAEAEAQRQARQGQYDLAIQQHQRRVEADVDRVAEGLGGVRRIGPVELGQTVKTGLKETQKEARTTSTALYDEALSMGNPAAPVPLATTRDIAGKILAEERGLRPVGRSGVEGVAAGLKRAATSDEAAKLEQAVKSGELPGSLAQRMIDEYGLSETGTRTLAQTVAIKQRLGAAMRAAYKSGDDISGRLLRKLSVAVSEDLKQFSRDTGGPFMAKMAQADAHYWQNLGQDFTKGMRLRRAMQSEPGLLGERLLGMTDKDLVGRTMARLPPTEAAQVRTTAFERLVQRATKGGELDAAKLDLELSKIPMETRQALFGSADRDLSALQVRLREVAPKREQAEALLTKAHQQAALSTKQQLDALKAEQTALPKKLAIPRDVEKTMGLTTDRVISELTQGKAGNVGELPRVWRMLTPKTKQEVRQSMVTSWLDQAKSGGVFSTERFATAARKVPDSVRAIILHEEPRQALREIEMVLDRVNRFDKATANPSGTSQALTSTFEVLRAVTRTAEIGMGVATGVLPNPATLAASGALVVGPGLIGRAMTSQWARKLFTVQGLNSIPPAQRPAAALIRLMLTPATQTIQGRVGATPAPQETPK